MAHDPSKCSCSTCKYRKSRFIDGFENVYCKKDNKIIEFWGEDTCPLKD